MSLMERNDLTNPYIDRPESKLKFYKESTLMYILKHIFQNISDREYNKISIRYKDLYQTWEQFRTTLNFVDDEEEEEEEEEEDNLRERGNEYERKEERDYQKGRSREDLIILSKQFLNITSEALFLVKDSQPYMIKYEPKPNKNIISEEMLQEYLKDNDRRILTRSIANDKTLNLTLKSDDIVLDRYCALSKISFPLIRQRISNDLELTDFGACIDEIYANPKKTTEPQSKKKLKKSNFYIYRHATFFNPIIITTLIENFIMRSKYWILFKSNEQDEENKYLNLRKVQKIFSKFKFEFFKKFPEMKTIIKEVNLKLLEFKDTNSNNYERIYFTLKFSLLDTKDNSNNNKKGNKNIEKDKNKKNNLKIEKEEKIRLLKPKIKLFYEYLNNLLEKQKFKIESPERIRFNNLVCFQVHISTELKSSLKIINEIDIFNKFLSKFGELVYCNLSFNFKNDIYSKIHIFNFLIDLQTDNVPYKSWNYAQDKPFPIYSNKQLPEDKCAIALSLEILITSPLVYCPKCLLIGHYHEECPYFSECKVCSNKLTDDITENDDMTENDESAFDDDDDEDDNDEEEEEEEEENDAGRSIRKNTEHSEYNLSDDEQNDDDEEQDDEDENVDELISHNFFRCPKTTKQDVIQVIKKLPSIVFIDEFGNLSPFSEMYAIECKDKWDFKEMLNEYIKV
ncbi:hypothetical protein B5S32_g3264 [[Candida] boidinii]|nr:hypothetical protein B5S32_g3264 [[Candida] boidinii]